jgi:hypothetical protein
VANGSLGGLGRGAASAVVLVGTAIAAVLAGSAGPSVTVPETPADSTLAFEPTKLTVVVTKWVPPVFWDWPDASRIVRIRGTGTVDIYDPQQPPHNKATTHLSSGGGKQLSAKVTPPHATTRTLLWS